MGRKRVPFLDDKYKKDFVDSMARKLAVGESEILAVRKKPSLLVYSIPGLAALIIGITAFFIFASPQKEVHRGEQIMPGKAADPAALLSESYQRCELGLDEYAGYLCDILVSYDSLPAKYRTEVPLVRPDRIMDTLVSAWPRLRVATKQSLRRDLPEIEERLGTKTASDQN
ncbi:MAG: hypothetical protein ACLFVQ_03565 [Chitinispirillaceae bacterium]